MSAAVLLTPVNMRADVFTRGHFAAWAGVDSAFFSAAEIDAMVREYNSDPAYYNREGWIRLQDEAKVE